MKKRLSLKISISGVRGVVGDSLTPQLAARFAQAFGSYLGRGKIFVGQDARASGFMIKNAVISGLLSVGCQPVDVGICPIPSFLVLTKENNATGGIAVTASHNPKDWNGLKFISGEGLYLNPSQTQEFLDIYHQGEFSLVHADKHNNLLTEENPTGPHLQKLLNTLDIAAIRRRKFKVVTDCSNGAGAVLVPEFLEAMGCESILLNATPDGALAHHPAPIPENLTRLCQAVVDSRADVGFIQDADADRLAIVDENGSSLGEELTLALAVKYVLSKKPGPVVINLSTSQAIEDLTRDHNVPLIRTKIGEINVVEEILNTKAPIGGEGNGGVILPAIHPCRDSFTAMGLTLEHMACTGKTISQLRQKIPSYVMLKDKINGSPEEAYRIIRQLKKKYGESEDISTLDGLKINFADHWVHIRPSNTEPIIRILVEAKSQRKAEEVLCRFKIEMSGL
ncbi:MAG: phosphoglucosamine mutase [Candidatus Aminicenantes bacterium]|nr:phosphoglucosamine mutase [Candidatus Aminicenantes bacterium]